MTCDSSMYPFPPSFCFLRFYPAHLTNTKKLQIKSLIVDTLPKQETKLLDLTQKSKTDEKLPSREKNDGNESWLQNSSERRQDEKA